MTQLGFSCQLLICAVNVLVNLQSRVWQSGSEKGLFIKSLCVCWGGKGGTGVGGWRGAPLNFRHATDPHTICTTLCLRCFSLWSVHPPLHSPRPTSSLLHSDLLLYGIPDKVCQCTLFMAVWKASSSQLSLFTSRERERVKKNKPQTNYLPCWKINSPPSARTNILWCVLTWRYLCMWAEASGCINPAWSCCNYTAEEAVGRCDCVWLRYHIPLFY